ncbi:AMP-binding protein, partial [bacterium]|nr:AMP-binding protein [bacterium]
MNSAPKYRIQKELSAKLTAFLTKGNHSEQEFSLAQFLAQYKIEDLQNYATALLQEQEKPTGSKQLGPRDLLVAFLDFARSPAVLRRVQEEKEGDAWFALLLKIIRKTNFTTGRLFRQRVNRYGGKTLFKIITDKKVENYSWQEVSDEIDHLAGSLLSAIKRSPNPAPVAIFSNNRLEMILLDLACLCYGIKNVMIPVNSIQTHIEYILQETQAQVLFVSRKDQLEKVLEIRSSSKHLRLIVSFDKLEVPGDDNLLSLEDFLRRYNDPSRQKLKTAANKIKLNDVASVMYTSGTTEAPKGIKFSQLNIVSKRFSRAIALPEIGDEDTFLCYLPLFHTFGRWFEMLGCVFWGSTYAFMQNPSLDTMIDNMKRIKPTVFISIPKKWIQLYEKILDMVDDDRENETEIRQAIRECTGGKLRWGLSAAGYLDPEIFQFFQNHGIELMSGFGMTEATGGITMTPPGRYKPNSVGTPLPGIRIKLAQDGEMIIKGPYVMKGYLKRESKNFRDGWFRTGDIFAQDDDGFFAIVDRKKEIYKNVRGETIAPQKIENLFRDFDVLRSVYLVGDHREYNTVLIYPNYDYEMIDLGRRSEEELREFFGSIVTSVNRFLAPYERIVNFAIVERDFDARYGEITEKGTYKRKKINQNFRADIEKMYEKPYASVTLCGVELRIPNWLLRENGLTADDLGVRKSSIILKPSQASLTLKCRAGETDKLRLGDGSYRLTSPVIDLGQLVEHPAYWLGNIELVNFVGADLFNRPGNRDIREMPVERTATDRVFKINKREIVNFEKILTQNTPDLKSLHTCAFVLNSDQLELALKAVLHLRRFLKEPSHLLPLARLVLQRAAWIKNTGVMREAFKTLILNESD